MLRKAILIILFTLTAVAVLTRTAETTERLRRITNTPEQALNLNPILSDDGRFVVFESTSDLANLGGPDGRLGFAPLSNVFDEQKNFLEMVHLPAAQEHRAASNAFKLVRDFKIFEKTFPRQHFFQ